MLTLEETIELILKSLPEYQRQDILKMIDEKRQELGPEVVNEESAAMIVARELGIDLQQISDKARLKIEDIDENTRSVALTGKIVSIGPVRTFSRKGEGGEGKVASIVLADETGQIRVALWDDITSVVSEENVKLGDVIQIRGGYLRKGLGDALEINLGRQGGIKVLDEYELEELDIKIEDREAAKIAELKEKVYDVTLVAKIQRVFGLSTFTRQKDGTEGKVLSIIVADESGSTRLVFWDKDAEDMQDAKEGEVIKVTGAYTKAGRYGDVEVHAGRSSQIERKLKVKIKAVEVTLGAPAAEPLGKKDISDLTPEMRDVDLVGKVAKIFPITTFEKDGREGKVQNIVVADESGSIRLTFWNEDVDKIEKLDEGDIIEVKHGYVKKGFRDALEFTAGRRAEIKINPKGTKLEQLDLSEITTQPKAVAGRVMIAEIDDNTAGKSVEVCGVIVGIAQTSPVYASCPNCRKKVEEDDGKFTCAACEKPVKKPEYRMLYKITLDDGSGSIRATLFGKAGEDLLQMSAADAQKLIEKSGDKLKPLEENSDRILGRYVAVQGRVSKFRDSLDITANALEFADPVEEVKRMKDTLNELMG